MSFLVALAGASGIVAAILSLPLFDRGRFARRVEPYLSGLHGRPSRLLQTAPSASWWRGWAGRRLRVLPAARVEELVGRLDAAGYRGGPEAFRVEQATWAVVAGLAGGSLLIALAGAGVRVDVTAVPVLAVAAAVSGWLGRDWWLTKEIARRRGRLAEQLPVAIDLMTLSIVAGESVSAAAERVAGTVHGGIGDELDALVRAVRSGTPLVEALEDLGRRVPDAGMARFVDALCTGVEKGAPLADVLRAQADDSRDAYRRRLLELGGRREVLMLVPVVFLIMPVVIVFALFPGLVSLDLLVP